METIVIHTDCASYFAIMEMWAVVPWTAGPSGTQQWKLARRIISEACA